LEHAVGVVVNAVLPQLAVVDQVLVARQAGDADRGRDAVVHCRQPPGPRAAHAHARGADALHIHLGPAAQIIEVHLIVAHEPAPERAAHPQVALVQALLLGPPRLGGPGPPRAAAAAAPAGVPRPRALAG